MSVVHFRASDLKPLCREFELLDKETPELAKVTCTKCLISNDEALVTGAKTQRLWWSTDHRGAFPSTFWTTSRKAPRYASARLVVYRSLELKRRHVE